MSDEYGPDERAERAERERGVHSATPEPLARCVATYGTTEYRCTGVAGHTDDHTAYSATTDDLEWSDVDNAKPLREPRGFCEAMSPDGTVRCSLSKGHKPPAIDGDGETYDHAAPSFGVWWNTEAPAGPDAPRCGSRPEPFGWATRETRCLLVAGHEGHHRAGAVEWSVGADETPWVDRLFRGMRKVDAPEIPRMFANDVIRPPAVRVRFVDLPNRHSAMAGPMGSPMHIGEPGGFALVVDRFRDRAHCDGERANWDGFGSMIGAHVVLCYPGDLDIVGWFDNV